MREAIYSIPIHDVFNEKCGCPIRTLYEMLEKRCTEYIMGAAMMEPDIRIETNRYGFCGKHLHQMSGMKNRLSLALMLETHLEELADRQIPPSKHRKDTISAESCFVCREVDAAARRLLSSALHLYESDPDFRRTFWEQEFFCQKHYTMLHQLAEKVLPRRTAAVFQKELTELVRQYVDRIRRDVHDFSTMFDYRNAASKEDERVRHSIEQAIRFLE